MRAFEAAARHSSFTRAAAELSVTPAAVSHHIKGLEASLGAKLFRRMSNGIELTDAGAAYVPGLRDGFDRLADANRRVRALGGRDHVAIRVAPSLAIKWLAPRLDRFHLAHPGIELRIESSPAPVDFAHEPVDLAIRPHHGAEADMRVDQLLGGAAFPVCSPRLAKPNLPLHVPEDLRRYPLLHVVEGRSDPSLPTWTAWLEAAGITGIDSRHGPRYPRASVALQAAIEGRGVALGSTTLVADDLDARRLVRLFRLSIPVELGYCLICPGATADKTEVAAFRDWILAEARAFEAGSAPSQR
jgi:LysR family glycine cleavage system transcriptional activator